MKYIILILAGYLAFRGVSRFFQNFRIVNKEPDHSRSKNADTGRSRYINEADIEDAEFKDLD